MIALGILLFPGLYSFSQVGISTDQSAPDPSAMQDVKSTDKGLLIPRIETSKRLNMVSPANGLMVYDSDLNQFYVFEKGYW
jgi:hypothetical protein